MNRLLLLPFVVLAGCTTSLSETRTLHLFGGYKLMEIPRAEVAVGARWVQGYGPAGEGAAAENIQAEAGIASLVSTEETQVDGTVRVEPLVSADPSGRSKATANLAEATIYRVKDVRALDLRPGESRLYEVIRAGQANIQIEQGSRSDMAAGVRGLPIDVAAGVETQRQRSVAIEGQNLIVAYRVIHAKPIRAKTHEGQFRASGGAFHAFAGRYRARVEPTGCACAEDDSQCEQSELVIMTDNERESQAEIARFVLTDDAHQSFLLPPGEERPARGGSILDLWEVAIRLRAREGPAGRGGGSETCGGSHLEPMELAVTRTTVQLRVVESPEAPGW